jgi:hypothetical protein
MKYNLSAFESIKDSLNKKQQSTDNLFKDFLKLEKDNTYIVRLLPNVEDFEKSFFHYYSHIWQSKKDGSMINVFCPNSYSERCPIDEYRSKVWKTGSEEEKETIKPLKRNENWLVNVYVVKDPTNPENQGKVKILRYGKQLNKIVMNAINGDESDEFGPKIFDLSENGCNLKIKVETNEGGYPNYVSSKFQSPSKILDTDDIDDIYSSVKPLDQIFKHQSESEIENILNTHWFGKTTINNSVKKESKQSVNEDSDDDIKLDDFTSDLKPDDISTSDDELDKLLSTL